MQGRGICRDAGGGGPLGCPLADVYIHQVPSKNYSAILNLKNFLSVLVETTRVAALPV